MSEQYLPIKKSLGYRSVKKAFWKVFRVDLNKIQLREGEHEDYAFDFVYKGYKINMGISATGKDIQFEIGEGGIFDILFLTPNKNFLGVTFIYDLITNEENRKKIKRVLGKNKRDVEEALIILKEFLDSDDARILLESPEEE